MKNEELYVKVMDRFKEFMEEDKEFEVVKQGEKYIVVFYDGIGFYAKYMEDPEQLFETLLQEWDDSFEEQLDVELHEMSEEKREEFNKEKESYLAFFKKAFGKEFAGKIRRQKSALSY